ncbi:hypothetical protein CBP34_17000 [Acidovorax carolinensis]|uniref:Uncharacterized protein n=1 Tax=Acidovorax carolinensis TaxID=553814 RepID=A0A240U6K3_9BURK|nr:hypothetical protein [Acidovorax carolinensis]ART53021.1 hypothetical protein CBP34_17000 [Acidovorax carolinensis]
MSDNIASGQPVTTLQEQDRLADQTVGVALTGGIADAPDFAQTIAAVRNNPVDSFAYRNTLWRQHPDHKLNFSNHRIEQKGLPDIRFHSSKYSQQGLTRTA